MQDWPDPALLECGDTMPRILFLRVVTMLIALPVLVWSIHIRWRRSKQAISKSENLILVRFILVLLADSILKGDLKLNGSCLMLLGVK